MYRIALTLFLVFATSAAPSWAGSSSPSEFVTAVGEAHGIDTWRSKGALETKITVDFGGQRLVTGTLLTDTAVGKVRLTLDDGTVVIYNHGEAWTHPADSEFQGARFHILTWPYFLAAPMKLNDPGTHVELRGSLPLDGDKLAAARLSFDDGVGDSPDDWYVLYQDGLHRLAGMAYIVTFGKETAEAEKEPHAITYHDFAEVDGVTLSKHWKFWNWTEEGGIHGDQIGEVKLSEPRFVGFDPSLFEEMKGSRPEPAPAP